MNFRESRRHSWAAKACTYQRLLQEIIAGTRVSGQYLYMRGPCKIQSRMDSNSKGKILSKGARFQINGVRLAFQLLSWCLVYWLCLSRITSFFIFPSLSATEITNMKEKGWGGCKTKWRKQIKTKLQVHLIRSQDSCCVGKNRSEVGG